MINILISNTDGASRFAMKRSEKDEEDGNDYRKGCLVR